MFALTNVFNLDYRRAVGASRHSIGGASIWFRMQPNLAFSLRIPGAYASLAPRRKNSASSKNCFASLESMPEFWHVT
jgi:hypothetical protein